MLQQWEVDQRSFNVFSACTDANKNLADLDFEQRRPGILSCHASNEVDAPK